MKSPLLLLIGLLISFTASSQLTVTSTMTPQQYVENVLVGTGVQVSNVKFNGNANYSGNQIGKFDYTGNQIDFTGGVVLSTGNVRGLKGPNNNDEYSSPVSGTSVATDNQLQALFPNYDLFDIGALEFDFIPSGNTVSFNFMFGSDEYNEYVCTQFNDIFGFFVTALTPGGGTYNNTNLALVPGTNVPITINTINNGTSGGFSIFDFDCDNADPNWRNNRVHFNGAPGAHFQADGMTKRLNITFNVVCGESYHFKFAIADGSDPQLDSWVLLQSGSFTSDAVVVSVATVSGDSTVAEGCTTADFIFTRPVTDTATTLTINYDISGTATSGVDYPAMPNPIVFLPGQDSVVITLSPIQDNIVEGPESVIIRVYIVNQCGDTIISEGTVWILDKPEINITENDPVALCSSDSIVMTAVASGGFPPYTYSWSNGQTGSPAYGHASINGPTNYYVTATDHCGFSQVDTVTITLNQTLSIDSLIQHPATSCSPTGSTAGFASGFSGTPTYNWSGPGPNSPNSTNTSVFTNLAPGWYYFKITDNVCSLKDSIQVTQEQAPVANFTASAVTGCNPLTVTFTNTSQNTSSYVWNFGNGDPILNTNDRTTHTATFTPGGGATHASFTVTLTASHEGCSDTRTITINVANCGCTDPNALNFDPTAELDNGSCAYPEPIINVPNVFTPDGDGNNPMYFLATQHVLKLEMWIFNRWGNVMFYSDDVHTTGWDGQTDSKDAADGVYFVKYIATGYVDKKLEGHTFFHVIRK